MRLRARALGRAVLLLLGLALAPAGWASDEGADAPTAPAQAKAAAEEANANASETDAVVCKRVKVTGSHMRQRVCFKRSEWRAMREHAREVMSRKLQNTSSPSG